MLIRKVSSSDREAIVSIVDRTANLTEEERICAAELLDIYLNNPLQTDYFFITATDESDCPAGYVCYGKTPLAASVYDLYWIVVDPALRGKGIGKELLKATEGILGGLGARMLVAETSGLPEYEPARAFYLKNGFYEEARIKEFYKPGDDLIMYIKRF